jgi:hypothetical protein
MIKKLSDFPRVVALLGEVTAAELDLGVEIPSVWVLDIESAEKSGDLGRLADEIWFFEK